MTKFVALLCSLTLAVAAVGVAYLHGQANRYSLASIDGEGLRAYKIDRRTGQAWLIVRDIERAVIPDKPWDLMTQEERAIHLAKESHALGGGTQVNSLIHNWMEQSQGTLRIHGWSARQISDQTFLVSYTYDGEGQSNVGWYFDVNLEGWVVRDALSDPDLIKAYDLQVQSQTPDDPDALGFRPLTPKQNKGGVNYRYLDERPPVTGRQRSRP